MNHSTGANSLFQPTGQLHFGVSLVGPAAGLDFEQLRALAQTAERGLFTLLTLDERYWLGQDPGTAAATDPAGSNEVTTLLAALAAVTTNIGLVAAAAPDYDDPAGLVNRTASLDRVSGGRAGWHLLADAPHAAAPLSGGGSAGDGDGRATFVESGHRIWAAWDDAGRSPAASSGALPLGAFQRDGHLYNVALGAQRQQSQHTRPVVLHAGDSAPELAFAAKYADVVMCAPSGLGEALAIRRDMVARTLAGGRGPNAVKILQGATFILADTDAAAVDKAEWLRAQLPAAAWDESAFIGSYQGVADLLLDFARSGAVDGFNIMPWLFPSELSDIVNHLIPELQDRGAYPADYAANTLRGNFGLPAGGRLEAASATHAVPVIDVGDLADIRLDLDLRMELIVQKAQA